MPIPNLLNRMDDVVTLSIWFNSEFFQQKGHLTLRTYRGGPNNTGIYASFWPHRHNDSKYMGAEFTVSYYPGGCFRTVNYDLLKVNQGQPPDYKVHLKGFSASDINKINDEFKKILSEKPVFSIYGSVQPVNFVTKKANCTQIVYRLLKAGGLLSEASRAAYYATGAGLAAASTLFIGVDMVDNPGLNWYKGALMMLWGSGIFIGRMSQYKGSTLMPILSSFLGGCLVYRGGSVAKEALSLLTNMSPIGDPQNPSLLDALLTLVQVLAGFFAMMGVFVGGGLALMSIPVMFVTSYFPINFPVVSLVKTPEEIYRLTENLSNAIVEENPNSRFNSNASFFNKALVLVDRNKFPIGITAGTFAAAATILGVPTLRL